MVVSERLFMRVSAEIYCETRRTLMFMRDICISDVHSRHSVCVCVCVCNSCRLMRVTDTYTRDILQ